MRIFVSYAREDRPQVDHLASRLSSLGHQVWLDASIRAGEQWWNEILRRIQECDIVLLAVSPPLLDSQACGYERAYAAALNKPLLPVMVAAMSHSVLPADLAGRHIIDYATRSEDAAFALATGLQSLPRCPPLPNPLPAPPPVPLSYLNGIRDLIERPMLNHREQMGIVEQLAQGGCSPDGEERAAAHGLLLRFGQRPDLYDVPAQRIRAVLAAGPSGPGVSTAAATGASSSPWQAPRASAPGRSRATNVFVWIAGLVAALALLGALLEACMPAPNVYGQPPPIYSCPVSSIDC